MSKAQYQASAPAQIKLFGEYGVLDNYPGIACALNRTITVTITPRQDSSIHFSSDVFGTQTLSLHNLTVQKPLEFLAAACRCFPTPIPSGFDLCVTSQICPTFGLGSSSAVTAATLQALAAWLDPTLTPHDLYHIGLETILESQKVGSGIDLAAACFGGIVVYEKHPLSIRPLHQTLPLSLVYSGHKIRTQQMVTHVHKRFDSLPHIKKTLYETQAHLTREAAQCIESQDLPTLGTLMNIHQGIQNSLGTSNAHLESLLDVARAQTGIWGAKISGAGLGDCIVTLGHLPDHLFPTCETEREMGVQQLETMTIEPHGVHEWVNKTV